VRHILSITRMTLAEARQRKVLWALILLGLAFLGLYTAGFYFIYREISRSMGSGSALNLLEPTNFLLMAGLYVVNFLVVVLAVLTSVDTVSGEIASGSIHTIVSKPLRRWHVLAGKWLGLALLLSAFSGIMAAALMGIVWLIAHYLPPNPLAGVGLVVLEGLVVLTLSILGGTRLSTLANGVVVFMLYGLAFIAGWIEQIGSYLHSESAVNIGIIVSLLMPSEAMWKRAAYLMQPTFLRELGLDLTPFGAASAPSTIMVVYAIAYIALALLLAVHWFNHRDL
jgi:Cu-processing system permease protein